ncbi:hypothetical protein CIB84_007770 [Bambusicola thoracicus]|uniref:Uncharacterized protein n=1 Tax=Bambusicola thoracicus TaxID=9083 RepID=A0A2P4SWH8_BAMTH|nr:hypothetical protein CIB84_007770 [Bambusicola thoracicus]
MEMSPSVQSAGGRVAASRAYSWAFLFGSFFVLWVRSSAATSTVPVKKAVRNFAKG